jgi:hypothetical protein
LNADGSGFGGKRYEHSNHVGQKWARITGLKFIQRRRGD